VGSRQSQAQLPGERRHSVLARLTPSGPSPQMPRQYQAPACRCDERSKEGTYQELPSSLDSRNRRRHALLQK
jgi:hypothetical protein